MAFLTSTQALQMAAEFAIAAEQMRCSDAADFQSRANIYEIASRIAFLRAHAIAKNEDARPVFGESFRPAAFAVA